VSAGIYGASFAYFWPQKLGLSPKMPLWVFRLLCIFIIICGLAVVFIPILFPDHSD
jgi:hypothetical protein